MSIRTTSALVKGVLVNDYDGSTDLTPYITAASVIVDRVVVAAALKKKSLSTAELELIERWLSAHFYAQSDKVLTSKSSGGASGSFAGQYGQGFDGTLYGQMAQRIDWTYCLWNLDKQQVATGFWLGKQPSEQVPFDQRS